jgi:parallel beta-helix repeat protein
MIKKLLIIAVITMMQISVAHAELQVNTFSQQDQKYPGISANSEGRVVIVWRNHNTDYGVGVYARIFDSDGRPLTDEFRVSSSTIDTHTWAPAVVMDDSGGFIAAWTATGSDGLTDVVMRLFDPNGQPITEELIINNSDYSADSVDIALNSNGDLVLVWKVWVGSDDHSGAGYIYACTYHADGTPKGEPFEVDPFPQCRYPKVGIQDSGDFIVTWLRGGDSQYPPSGYYLKFRCFYADGRPKSRGNSRQIMGDLGAATEPAIDVDADDRFTIAWSYHPDGWSNSDIYAQRFDSKGQALNDPFVVNSYTEGAQSNCAIACKPDGGFIVCWSGDGSAAQIGVHARSFNAQGLPTTDDITIACTRSDDYASPVVAIGVNQQPIVSWHAQNLDGSQYGVFVEHPVTPPSRITSIPQQFVSIQKAVNMAIHGDTILLEPGIYRENLNLQGKNITITSMEPINLNTVSTTILDGTLHDSVVTMVGSAVTTCTISGLTIRSGKSTYGGGINANHTFPVIRDCIIQDNEAFDAGGGIYACDGVMENCIIRYNRAPRGAGLAACEGVSFHCNVTQNNATETGGGLADCYGLICSSIIWGNETNQIANCQNISFSCVQEFFEGLGNIFQDPCFAFADDLHLMPQSPCIDTGHHNDLETDTDLDGLPRLLDGDNDGHAIVDMGILEFNHTAPCLTVSTRHVRLWSTVAQPDPNQYTVFIRNSGDGVMSWHIRETCPWLDVANQSGQSSGDVNELILDVNAADLDFGRFTCELEIISDQAINSPVTIAVQLDVVISKDEFHVPSEYPTIQSAIDAARDGQKVILTDGVYTGTGNMNLDMAGKAITVCSENGPVGTVIDCQYQGTGFRFHTNETSESRVEGLTIRHASSSGAIYCYSSSPTIQDCIIENNNGTYTIFLRNQSNAIIRDCIIRNNTTDYGGGIYCWASNTLITGCTIVKNTALKQGGGIRVYFNSHALIQNCVITDNIAINQGGGIHLYYKDSTATISNCTIANNCATAGGGIYCGSYASFDLSNSIVWGNTFNQIDLDNYVNPVSVSYTDIQGGWSQGQQILNTDPFFADPVNGDYHLQSSAGRWDPESASWVFDIVSSPCIDAGDPSVPVGLEQTPHGNRINLGAYGGTNQASHTP